MFRVRGAVCPVFRDIPRREPRKEGGEETSKGFSDSLETPRSKRWLLTRSEEQ
jgi:hypothetical protein